MSDSSLRPPSRDAATPAAIIEIVTALAQEVRAGSGSAPLVRLDSALERDLGFDSLERAELLLRLERAFNVRLPPRTLTDAETPRDLLRAVFAGSADVQEAQVVAAAELPEPATAIPDQAQTLVGVLEWHARTHGKRTHLTLLVETDAGPAVHTLAYGDLYQDALRVANGLARAGLESGQTAAIMLPTSLEFFSAFFGILLAGGIPVPIYPPASRSQLEEHLRRQSRIVANALATVLITVPEARGVARLLRATTPSLRSVVSVAQLRDAAQAPPWRRGGRDIAFLQYTSGSTGHPKGVILTHANVLANIRAMGRALQVKPSDVFVSWLPLYHDMGLIGAWLSSLYFALPLVVMPPQDFLARPERWLWALHRYRGTLSAGPNFAYERCATRLDASALTNLDLASWRVAFNGSEPVSPDTVTRFNERFAAYGFDARAQMPVYGLAESSVGLTFPPVFRGMVVDRVDRDVLARIGAANPAKSDDVQALRVVACGQPVPGHEIRIVDTNGRELPERQEGRIEFRGPSATSGYFRNPEATHDLFDGEWLETGDMGYIAGGELYLTGRAKDLIIRGGQHIHPQEAEAVIGEIPGVRKGCVTVFGVPDRAAGTEKVVVLAETREADASRREALRAAIATAGVAVLGAPPDDIVLAPPHTVLKTSSGKIRRAACADLYQRGMLRATSFRLWPQLVRLAFTGAAASLRKSITEAGGWLFAAYAWALLVPMAVAALFAVTTLPREAWRRHAVTLLARAFVKLSGIPLRITGSEHFPQTGPITVVANHASYIDGIVLLAAVPERCAFVAKKELAANWVLRLLLGRIGTHFVERFEIEGSVEAARELAAQAGQGASFVAFPEGTFGREPGLRPFHLGAFLAAASAGTAVIPLAMRGTRSVLRDGQWRPRLGPVRIVVLPRLVPDGGDWAAAIRLRDRARVAILGSCGEPDLSVA